LGEITDALRRARHEGASVPVGSEPPPIVAAESPRRRRAEGAATDAVDPHGASTRGLRARTGAEPIAPLPRSKEGDWIARAVWVAPELPISACFRHFAVRLRTLLAERPDGTVLVTSALRREGKTTTACNLALALAAMAAERRIALVDLDFHLPSVARGLGVVPSIALERVLDGHAPLAKARLCTEIPSLDVFATTASRKHALELFSSRRFGEVMRELAESYDAVVIDTPPVIALPDVAQIAPHVASCVAVVRAGATPTSAFREMLGLIPRDLLIGTFLNDARLSRHASYGYAYGPEPAEAATSDAD
jgi:Mrp family chromosome partitioning ATPase